MALFLVGKTKCPLCDQPIRSEAEALLFPAFLRPGHRLHRFSDAAFHSICFDSWADGDELRRLLSRFQHIMSTRPRGVSLEEANRWGAEAFRSLEDPEE